MDFAVSLENSVFTGTSVGPNLKTTAFRGHFWCSLTGHHGGVQCEHIKAGRLLHGLPCAIYNLLNVFWETSFITAQKSQVADYLPGEEEEQRSL